MAGKQICEVFLLHSMSTFGRFFADLSFPGARSWLAFSYLSRCWIFFLVFKLLLLYVFFIHGKKVFALSIWFFPRAGRRSISSFVRPLFLFSVIISLMSESGCRGLV